MVFVVYFKGLLKTFSNTGKICYASITSYQMGRIMVFFSCLGWLFVWFYLHGVLNHRKEWDLKSWSLSLGALASVSTYLLSLWIWTNCSALLHFVFSSPLCAMFRPVSSLKLRLALQIGLAFLARKVTLLKQQKAGWETGLFSKNYWQNWSDLIRKEGPWYLKKNAHVERSGVIFHNAFVKGFLVACPQ